MSLDDRLEYYSYCNISKGVMSGSSKHHSLDTDGPIDVVELTIHAASTRFKLGMGIQAL